MQRYVLSKTVIVMWRTGENILTHFIKIATIYFTLKIIVQPSLNASFVLGRKLLKPPLCTATCLYSEFTFAWIHVPLSLCHWILVPIFHQHTVCAVHRVYLKVSVNVGIEFYIAKLYKVMWTSFCKTYISCYSPEGILEAFSCLIQEVLKILYVKFGTCIDTSYCRSLNTFCRCWGCYRWCDGF